MTLNTLASQLRRLLGNANVLSEPAECIAYESDALAFSRHLPDMVVLPGTGKELQLAVALLRESGFPYLARGAGTSFSGGPVACEGGIILHLSKLNRILEINAEDLFCCVEPGVVLADLKEALVPEKLFYPPDPSSAPSCTIGGNVAENAGGAYCFRYGVTGNYVLGIEVLLPDGSLRQFGGPAGGLGEWSADWKALMVGSEGTLGIFTKIWLRLLPANEKTWTFCASYPEMRTVLRVVESLASHPWTPSAIELMDARFVDLVERSSVAADLRRGEWLLLVEIDGPAELIDLEAASIETVLEEGRPSFLRKTDEKAEQKKLWVARKSAGGLMGKISPDLMVQDVVIPGHCLEELLHLIYSEADAAGIPVINVFHAGDGNLHPNFPFDRNDASQIHTLEKIGQRIMEKAAKLGGTLSGEHGIGNDKLKYMKLVFSLREIEFQRGVFECFNSSHQLNPGKILAGRTYRGNHYAGV